MTVDARPVVRSHPSPKRDRAEADDAAARSAAEARGLDDGDEPTDGDLADADDLALQVEGVDELTSYDLDDLDAEHREAEVEDTPGDDRTIAAARIERFGEAHRGVAPVDAGPFEERARTIIDDDSAQDPRDAARRDDDA